MDDLEYYVEITRPNRLSMRKQESKNGKISYEYPIGSGSKQNHIYQYIPKLLNKNIGKSFSKVFSQFCKDYPEFIGCLNTREEFKNHFIEYESYGFRGVKYNEFFIDKQGRIQHVVKMRDKKNKHEFYVDKPVYYYTLNKPLLNKYPILDSCFYRIIGRHLYSFCLNEEKIPQNIYNKICDLLHHNYIQIRNAATEEGWKEYYYVSDLEKHLFIRKTDTKLVSIKTNDPEYIKFVKEQNDAKKREYREYLKEKEELYEEALRKLKEQKELEKKQNIIDRDRLGFDDMSFKKEKYYE